MAEAGWGKGISVVMPAGQPLVLLDSPNRAPGISICTSLENAGLHVPPYPLGIVLRGGSYTHTSLSPGSHPPPTRAPVPLPLPQVFDHMQASHVEADVVACCSLINALERGGQWQLAEKLFLQMCTVQVGTFGSVV